MTYIITELKDEIGTITFNNDAKRNCLNAQMLCEINEALQEYKAQKTRVVILRAKKGAKVWSAGFDISELPEPGRDPLSYNDPLEQLLREVQKFPAPVISMVEGGVWGGACDLAFVSDLIIGTHSATFAITPAKIGIPYNPSGIMHFINTASYHIAKEMLLTALPMTAEQAKNLGILNHLIPEYELENFTYSYARKLKDNSPLSVAVIKEQLRILGNSYALNPDVFERIQGLRRQVYDSSDYIEGKRAFIEKRKPNFTGN